MLFIYRKVNKKIVSIRNKYWEILFECFVELRCKNDENFFNYLVF